VKTTAGDAIVHETNPPARQRVAPGVPLKGAAKLAHRLCVGVETPAARLKKPDWIRIRVPSSERSAALKALLRQSQLHTVCEEASCPNLPECFGKGTATFMIMGEICTRRCPFCDVASGRPLPLDPAEPRHVAAAVRALGLRYVVITSVDRDDLADGGAAHIRDTVRAVRELNPEVRIEILTPDFRGCEETALALLSECPPDVFNHNLETVPRLYSHARPGARYQGSLDLLRRFRELNPRVPTKSGLMVGLGEAAGELGQVLHDLRAHGVAMLTIGQYLQPTPAHLPVARYVHPDEFRQYQESGRRLGFSHVASGPLVRSSYHADLQASGVLAGKP
jgi:lipoic acid synthetase